MQTNCHDFLIRHCGQVKDKVWPILACMVMRWWAVQPLVMQFTWVWIHPFGRAGLTEKILCSEPSWYIQRFGLGVDRGVVAFFHWILVQFNAAIGQLCAWNPHHQSIAAPAISSPWAWGQLRAIVSMSRWVQCADHGMAYWCACFIQSQSTCQSNDGQYMHPILWTFKPNITRAYSSAASYHLQQYFGHQQ